MNETKFTPGPWVFDPETTCATVWAGMAPSGSGTPGRLVAQVCGDDALAEPNANLIAAAPEMFKALLALANRFSYIEHTQDGHLISAARAALDKAVQP